MYQSIGNQQLFFRPTGITALNPFEFQTKFNYLIKNKIGYLD